MSDVGTELKNEKTKMKREMTSIALGNAKEKVKEKTDANKRAATLSARKTKIDATTKGLLMEVAAKKEYEKAKVASAQALDAQKVAIAKGLKNTLNTESQTALTETKAVNTNLNKELARITQHHRASLAKARQEQQAAVDT